MAPTEHTTAREDTDIETAATDLQEFFAEMSRLMNDLSESMGEVADGFAPFGQGTTQQETPETGSSTAAFGAAED